MYLNFIKNAIVFLVLYIPPLILFMKYWNERGRGKVLLLVISIIYLILSLFTQNLLPFILVLICIKYIRDSGREDYYSYGFTIKNFKILRAFKYSLISYLGTIIIAIIALSVFSLFNFPIKDQEIITQITELPLKRYIMTIPIIVIFAPIIEEFTFRWLFLQKIFKNRLGMVISSIITSLIFSLVHFNLKSFPAIFWIGLFNCYLINKHGYWYAVFNHAFFNSVSTFAILIQKLY
ncbi:CPBP family intramembrane metalloprotease [Clostridium malenominatum]|uniref:CPBP family intramembrane metalloprotease n=1 Tax=Clostridium malenominatum TaxID=1539 RepID=A0ABN1INE7_9CLOT